MAVRLATKVSATKHYCLWYDCFHHTQADWRTLWGKVDLLKDATVFKQIHMSLTGHPIKWSPKSMFLGLESLMCCLPLGFYRICDPLRANLI